MSNWTFHAWDTLFFRDSRPFHTGSGSELASIFPPPIRALAGAVRSRIGDHLGVDWRDFAAAGGKPYPIAGIDLVGQIGFGDDLGALSLRGPWLVHEGRRLYPAPALLVEGRTESDASPRLERLRIRDSVTCDLGRVLLPTSDLIGAKMKTGTWLTAAGLAQVLAGGLPQPDQIKRKDQLVVAEARLGIARDNRSRIPRESLLYQTRHIRPRSDVAFRISVGGIDPSIRLPKTFRLKLGGEGRLATVTIEPEKPGENPPVPEPVAETKGILLCLLTPADLGGDWKPPGFQRRETNGTTSWTGRIAGVALELVAAAIGPAIYRGGWDLARRRPRPIRAWLPAGTTWYFRVREDSPAAALQTLHFALLDGDNKLGLGQLAAGLWNSPEFPE